MTSPADFLASEDGQTLVEAGAEAWRTMARDIIGGYDVTMRPSEAFLLAILSATKSCPTCAGSGDGQARHPVGRDVAGYWRCTACNYTFGIGGQESARAHSAEEGSGCLSCQGTGTVPILPIPE